MKEGLSGNIAKAFIQSKLTILLMIGFLLIGGYSTMLIPREEEPQIDVPMADIFLRYPGASPKEVEARVSQPLEKIISSIKGVEYVYSTSMKGQAMLIVQFWNKLSISTRAPSSTRKSASRSTSPRPK